MSIWVTRSAPDNLITARALRGLHRRPLLLPVMSTRPLSGSENFARPDAVVFTSVHAVRHHRSRRLDAPAFAASSRVSDAAALGGYATVTSTGGDERALGDLLRLVLRPFSRVLIHCADRTSFLLTDLLQEAGHPVERAVVYEPVPMPTPSLGSALELLPRIDGIVVHSRSGAERLRELLDGRAWRGTLGCMSPAAAARLEGLSGATIELADRPTEAALMRLIGSGPTGGPGRRPAPSEPCAHRAGRLLASSRAENDNERAGSRRQGIRGQARRPRGDVIRGALRSGSEA